MSDSNGWGEHKVHVNAEIERLDRDVRTLDARMDKHELICAKNHGVVVANQASMKESVDTLSKAVGASLEKSDKLKSSLLKWSLGIIGTLIVAALLAAFN